MIEKIIKNTKEKFKGFKDTIYNPKRHDENYLGIGALTEYDIDRIRGEGKNESYKRNQRNN